MNQADKLKFPDEVTNLAASERNPIKHGIFVRHLHANMAEYVTAQGVHHTPLDNLIRKQPEPQNNSELLVKMRCQVKYTDVATIPIPLYEEIKAALQTPEEQSRPVAMRYGWDGYGYKYIDSSSGSDWENRISDAEPLYLQPANKADLEKVREVLARSNNHFNHPLAITPGELDYLAIETGEALAILDKLLGKDNKECEYGYSNDNCISELNRLFPLGINYRLKCQKCGNLKKVEL